MAMKCSASGVDRHGAWECDKTVSYKAHGLCVGHYKQQYRGEKLARLRRQVRRHDPMDMIGNGVGPGMQECTICHKIKPLSEFPNNPTSPNGKRSDCNLCVSERNRDRKFAPGAGEWLKEKLAEQGGECDGCGTDDPGKRGWCLHHDHAYPPSDPRGWESVLCFYCNFAEGFAKNGWNWREWAKRMAAADD